MRKLIICSLLLTMLLPSTVDAATATPSCTVSDVSVIDMNEDVNPCADIIETKYRIKDGKIQYRRWNCSRLCWVDSDWIDL